MKLENFLLSISNSTRQNANRLINKYGWKVLLGLVFYPVILLFTTPIKLVQTLWNCRILAEGKSHTFAGYANFDSALPVVKTWAKNWHAYQNMPGVHMIRYEDLLDNPDTVLKSCEAYLGIHTDDEKRQQIIWKFDRNNKQALKNGLHFNKAQVTRWMTELNEQQKKHVIESWANIWCQWDTSFIEHIS